MIGAGVKRLKPLAKPVAAFALGAGASALWRRLGVRCLLRGRHNPYRLRLGSLGLGVSAFACRDCPKVGATYGEMGFDENDDQVSVRARTGGGRW